MLREALENPKKKMIHKIRLLWRPELAHIQEINGMPAYKQKSKDFVPKEDTGENPGRSAAKADQ